MGRYRAITTTHKYLTKGKMMDLKQHLIRQMAFSHATFGPGVRREGVINHIKKELVEVEDAGGSAEEWVDVVILALDGLTRHLAFLHSTTRRRDPEVVADEACKEILYKQALNENRDWPDWRTADEDEPIEHIKDLPDNIGQSF